jgi:hypothetical protein
VRSGGVAAASSFVVTSGYPCCRGFGLVEVRRLSLAPEKSAATISRDIRCRKARCKQRVSDRTECRQSLSVKVRSSHKKTAAREAIVRSV